MSDNDAKPPTAVEEPQAEVVAAAGAAAAAVGAAVAVQEELSKAVDEPVSNKRPAVGEEVIEQLKDEPTTGNVFGRVDDGQPVFSSRRKGPVPGESPKQTPIKAFRNAATGQGKETELSRLYKEAVDNAPVNEVGDQLLAHGGLAAEGAPSGTGDDIKSMSVADTLAKFGVSPEKGLTTAQFDERMLEYGPNALPEIKKSKCLKFLSFMWNPLSWVMEAAALVAIILSNGPTPWLCPTDAEGQFLDPQCPTTNQVPDYPDFVGIILLLVINSTIGYYEEEQAGAAVDALMDQLTREYKVKRDGEWKNVEKKDMVPGDILNIKLGDIIPADCKVIEGEPMKIDQAALTGESLPVTRVPGGMLLSGTTVKQGHNNVIVTSTGVNTFAGKAEFLVATTDEMGHLQTILTQIGLFCLSYITVWAIILMAVLFGNYHMDYRRGIDMLLVVLIGGVPIAMPTVLSVTMAIGVNELAKEQAVVTRITAVEELAGMDILCSDKTGTLTKNKLTVSDPYCYDEFTAEDILLAAALSANQDGDSDAIDRCINDCMSDQMKADFTSRYTKTKFLPFDPVSKRTEAYVTDNQTGHKFITSKGAPQVILRNAHNSADITVAQNKVINDYALRGLRAIGVARCDNPEDEVKTWKYMGLISLSDPPRDDTKETISAAVGLGVRVIMITGDQVAIGRETARLLGMGLNFHSAHVLAESFVDGVPIATIIEEAHGWGEVMPEDKYKVVRELKSYGHLVGMTGDGVNDAPALKAADVGIAVADATDAARGASDMVLLTEGLSVIIKAILGSRCIFQRMRNYATYACATTIRIVTTFSLLACIWQFTYPPFLVLIIAVLNDGTIMTVSTDRVQPSMVPDSWRLRDIFIMAFVLGLYFTLSTIILFYLIVETTFFTDKFGLAPLTYNVTYPTDETSFQLVGVIYLQVSITGQLLIFSTRARTFFFLNRPSVPLMCAGVIAQLAATFIAVYGDSDWTQLAPIGWDWAGVAWVWSFIWLAPMDFPKMLTNLLMSGNLFKFRGGFEEVFQKKTGVPSKSRSRSGSGVAGSRRGAATGSRRGANASGRGRQ